MVLASPPISNSSGFFTIIHDITVTSIFHNLIVLWQGRSTYLFLRFLWVSFCGPPRRQSPLYDSFFFFFLIITKSSFLAGIRWYVCISKSHRILWASFSRTDSSLGRHNLVVWSNFNFRTTPNWFPFPPWHVYSYTIFVLYSLIMRWIISYKEIFDWFGLVSLFNGISTFVGYLMPKPFF